ncbi:XRE family transcriptional regulator [Streptomyces sp. ME02-6991-2B]|nr:XRE family transcriptional regulator [Streptomyces sp. ME02-6991-2B]
MNEIESAHPAMLTLARESREMTQAELADAMAKASEEGTAVSQGYVSRAEAGRLAVTGERLDLYAAALGYPRELLCLDPQVHGVGVGLVHHRKRAALSATALRRIHADLALTRLQVDGLAAAAGESAVGGFPSIALDALTTPQEVAGQVRSRWGLGSGPVPDVIAVLEAGRAVVVLRDLGSDLLDAVSQWDGTMQSPLVLINDRTPGDRCRFSLAHELGHLVMHHSPGSGPEQEKQADAFASAFLMPAEDIRSAFMAGADLARLADLKRHWRVSMAALLRRAKDLNAITEWQYRSSVIEMSALGYRTAEPVSLEPERPRRLPALVKAGATRTGSPEALAACAHLLPEDFTARYATPPSPSKARP